MCSVMETVSRWPGYGAQAAPQDGTLTASASRQCLLTGWGQRRDRQPLQAQDGDPCTLRICSWHAHGFRLPHTSTETQGRVQGELCRLLAKQPRLRFCMKHPTNIQQVPSSYLGRKKPCPCPPGALRARRERETGPNPMPGGRVEAQQGPKGGPAICKAGNGGHQASSRRAHRHMVMTGNPLAFWKSFASAEVSFFNHKLVSHTAKDPDFK